MCLIEILESGGRKLRNKEIRCAIHDTIFG